MRTMREPLRVRPMQAGISLVEIMVGLVIGLIAVAVIFQTFSVAEGFKRNTTSGGDAQQNGLFSTFTLALELANAGNGLVTSGDGDSSAQVLMQCPGLSAADAGDPDNRVKTMRPVPVVIYAGKKDTDDDAFAVSYSAATRLPYPALFAAPSASDQTYSVQSPTGFRKNDLMVVTGVNRCETSVVTNDPVPDANGVVQIEHKAVALPAYTASHLINMGPGHMGGAGQPNRNQLTLYDVDANGVLRSTDLLDPAATPVPLASNVVLMKIQYGIDVLPAPSGDGVLDTWVQGSDKDWSPADLLGTTTTLQKLRAIKAVRIGLIVRSAQYDREISTAMSGGDFKWVLFDCETHDAGCPGRLTGSIEPDANGGGYRYRVFETVVPLRNQLWNPK